MASTAVLPEGKGKGKGRVIKDGCCKLCVCLSCGMFFCVCLSVCQAHVYFVSVFSIVSISAINCMERLVSDMTRYVSTGT